MAKRTLRVRCATDSNRYDIVDGGLNDKGQKTQQRLQSERTLAKRIPLTTADGKPDPGGATIPLFVLDGTPPILHPNDPFDVTFLKDDDGNWKRPTKKWVEEQDRRIGRRSDSARRAEEQVKAKKATEVADGLASLAEAARNGAFARGDRERERPKDDGKLEKANAENAALKKELADLKKGSEGPKA